MHVIQNMAKKSPSPALKKAIICCEKTFVSFSKVKPNMVLKMHNSESDLEIQAVGLNSDFRAKVTSINV